MPKFQRNSIVPPLRLAFLMWVFFSVQFFFNIDLGFLGVFPRTTSGLIGILTAPMIHGSLNHILSNTFPLIFLGTTLFVFYNSIAVRVFLQCYFLTNICVWIFARGFYHIGASGLVYGLAFFLISFGFFRKNVKSLAIAIVVVVLYGGIIYGVLPSRPGVSWESHLFGALIGIGSAYTMRYDKSLDYD
ncbi:rhomboid family intramembrane serine protease [Reichenbachiella sp. MALMAid0571]|uniref:rhomboid family intramembrane serine protease n=1 Tax=Reichenbachiella sp. MALMAid0571 TaxID=3143939 RepID=UPI0032E00E9D